MNAWVRCSASYVNDAVPWHMMYYVNLHAHTGDATGDVIKLFIIISGYIDKIAASYSYIASQYKVTIIRSTILSQMGNTLKSG